MFGLLLSAMPVAERMLLIQTIATVLMLIQPTSRETTAPEEEAAAEPLKPQAQETDSPKAVNLSFPSLERPCHSGEADELRFASSGH